MSQPLELFSGRNIQECQTNNIKHQNIKNKELREANLKHPKDATDYINPDSHNNPSPLDQNLQCLFCSIRDIVDYQPACKYLKNNLCTR